MNSVIGGAKTELIVDEDAYERELDLLRFQVNEIEAAQLQVEEEETLEQSFQRATHSARLAELAAEAKALINGVEPSAQIDQQHRPVAPANGRLG